MRLVLDLGYDYLTVKTKYTYYDLMKLNAVLDYKEHELNKQANNKDKNHK
jgi:hypothetical protein